MEVVQFVTSNTGKFKEFQEILGDGLGFNFVHRALELPELQAPLEEIAVNKCMQAAEIVQGPVLVDDAALAFKALNGLPGPYTKEFLQKIGLVGLNNMLAAYQDKTAQAICTLAYTAGPGKEIKLFTGSVEGQIVVPTHPIKAMSFDAIFQPDGAHSSYAEMGSKAKNNCSHRYKALMLLKGFFLKKGYKQSK
ncbi:MAG TPA: non-canonical purine NTP pyrophosphatase [Amoebophilaceae bacterium]|jgi:inosine triphosphate pyrophosphatase|nr:non-canonical purine NTP pyrophosphatase [Amoebophilaceae bacterium]